MLYMIRETGADGHKRLRPGMLTFSAMLKTVSGLPDGRHEILDDAGRVVAEFEVRGDEVIVGDTLAMTKVRP